MSAYRWHGFDVRYSANSTDPNVRSKAFLFFIRVYSRSFATKHDVLRLDITVHDAFRVRILQPLCDLGHDVDLLQQGPFHLNAASDFL
jgi:hypothetical protein